jgi:hypothetical protein
MRIPIEFEDFDPQDPDIEFRKNRWNYWNILRDVRAEYLKDIEASTDEFNVPKFSEYMESNYGLRMDIVDGRITDKFDIVDEKLYTFFILKWT